jgi:hypothetical protein
MNMEQTECFEKSTYKIQTPRNYSEENIQGTRYFTRLCPHKKLNFILFHWISVRVFVLQINLCRMVQNSRSSQCTSNGNLRVYVVSWGQS